MPTIEKLLINYKEKLFKLCSEIEKIDITRLPHAEKLRQLQKLNVAYRPFLEYFDTYIDVLSERNFTFFSRQKTLTDTRCERTVTFLGFEFYTDFVFALGLEGSEEEESDTDINQSRSVNRQFSESLGTPTTAQLHNPRPTTPEIVRIQPEIAIMASNFDLINANKLIPDFDGDSKKLKDFIDKSAYYNERLNVAGRTEFLDFILKFKLLEKVKNKFSTADTPADFAALRTLLNDRFSDKTTKERKTDQIEKLLQRDTVVDFVTKLEDLTAELVGLKMVGKDENARPYIKQEVDELGIRVLTRGLKRMEVRQALIYKEPDTLANAIKFALEADAKFGTSNFADNDGPVNRYNNTQGYRGNFSRYRGNFNANRGGYQNNDSQGQGNFRPNFEPNRQFNDQNFTQNRNFTNDTFRGNYNNRGAGNDYYRGSYNNHSYTGNRGRGSYGNSGNRFTNFSGNRFTNQQGNATDQNRDSNQRTFNDNPNTNNVRSFRGEHDSEHTNTNADYHAAGGYSWRQGNANVPQLGDQGITRLGDVEQH